MNTQMAAFAFGCLLLLVAILGGGFELKMLKVPKVGRASRWVACLFGMFFVVIAVRPDLFASKHDESPAPAVAPAQPSPAAEMPPAALPQPEKTMQATAVQPDPTPAEPARASKPTPKPDRKTTTVSRDAGRSKSWPRRWWNRLKGDRP